MTQPNVLWLVSDHQAFANRGVDTSLFPLQARLRALGAEFTRAYTVLPICTPSRASMLTGKYPHAHGLTENDGRFGGVAELPGSEPLVHQPFAAAGYRCGWFGKWHLHHEASATDHGFEGISLPGYGYPYGSDAYRDYLSDLQPGPLMAEVEVPGEACHPPGTQIDLTAQDAWFDYEAGSAILHGPEEVHEAHFLAYLAQRWIDGLTPDQPFFARVDTWGPHPPYTVPAGFDAGLGDVPLSGNLTHGLKMRPGHHRDYRDQWRKDLRPDAFDWPRLTRRAIEHGILVERALVKLVDHLADTGRLDNTIIVFCADHGEAVASNGGVMNKGSLMVEETLRIPLLIAGPGVLPGHSYDALTGNIDIAPTLLDLCGLPGLPAAQGRSAAASLRSGKGPAHRQRLMVEHYGLHVPILQRGLYAQDWKYVIQGDGFEELYQLSKDPFEMQNLSGEPAASDRLAHMRAQLAEEQSNLGDSDPRLHQIAQTLA